MVTAILHELELRQHELRTPIETIYFGGGTPSLLEIAQVNAIVDKIISCYNLIDAPEITLEANPDDLTSNYIPALANETRINRLSIGVQSFREQDLKLMNRAHSAKESHKCLSEASKYFDNITIDLIYGIPGLSNEDWKQNIDQALSYNVNHISSYALTVEPKTALEKMIANGSIPNTEDELAQQHFYTLIEKLEQNNFVHYELSNFGKKDYFSKHNTSYWKGKSYLGIGPSAHSYSGKQRSWNIANNVRYIKAIENNELPSEVETLSTKECFNEYVMTGLRTIFGVSLEWVEQEFGKDYDKYLSKSANRFIQEGLLKMEDGKLITTKKGKFLCDGIASDLFMV